MLKAYFRIFKKDYRHKIGESKEIKGNALGTGEGRKAARQIKSVCIHVLHSAECS